MDIIEHLTIHLNNRLKRRAVANIRKECSLLGNSLDQYTDQQIEEGIYYMSKILAQTGVSKTDFAEALKTIAKLGV